MQLTIRGFTLTEMMIAMALSCVMFTALVSVVGQVIEAQRSNTAALRLENEISVIAHTLVREITRTGFVANSAVNFITANGTASEIASSLSLSAFPGEIANSCILFRYDSNRNGRFDTEQPSELYGFRLRNRAVEMRIDGKSCNEPGWHDLSDYGEFRITRLTFRLLPTAPPQLHFVLSAALAKDAAVTRRYEYTVGLENG